MFPKNPATRPINRDAWIALMLQKRRRARIPSEEESVAFVPPDYQLRLKADSLAIGLGDPIEVWPDLSGNGNDAFQFTVASQPTFEEVAFAGKTFNVARFDTVDDGMETPLVINSPFSIFVMWRPSDLDMTTSIISSNTLNWMMGTFAGGMLCYFSNWSAGGVVNTGDFFLFEVRITPGQPLTWAFLNGVQTELQPYFTGSDAPEQVTLGAVGANGYPGGCDAAEILIYDRLLSEEEAVGVRNYFQAEYNFLKL